MIDDLLIHNYNKTFADGKIHVNLLICKFIGMVQTFYIQASEID